MVPVTSFPLLQLPKNATMVTLRALDYLKLFEISLASKKTKKLVQSLKIKAFRFTVCIDYRPFSIMIGLPRRVPANQKFRTIWHRPDDKYFYYKQYSNQMDEKTFIDHLKFIFHTEKFTVDFGYKPNLFDFVPILQGRQDIESIDLITNNQEEDRRILKIMKPSQAHIFNFTRLRDILIQNFDYLDVDHEIIRLEDLLISNVRNFEAYCSTDPRKVLNRFLKLWTRGSNLQIESLELSFPINNDFSEEEILAGLKRTENNTVRYFKSASGSRRVNGGTDIFRFDGTIATILTSKRGVDFKFEMLVWHDHCIAKNTDL